MIKWGFEFGIGGNKNGTGDYIDRLTAAGIPTAWKGTDDAGLCYQAQETGHPDSVLIYRVSTEGQKDGNDYDVPRYDLAPSEAAALHFQITSAKRPPELIGARVWSEPINEPRAKPDPNKPNYQNMHPCDWLGEFMTEYAILAYAAGHKVCGPGFNAGEPGDDGQGIIDAVNQYSQPGMLRWLRYCAENPESAALSVHEYTQDLLPYANSYPHKLGRFQAAIAAADLAGIPRAFRIFITEFGWTLNTVPDWQTAVNTIQAYSQLSAKFPQLEVAAIWSLRAGWGDISSQLAQYISDNGNPFANWQIDNQYPTEDQPQATAVEFGGTLPVTLPNNGGNNVTKIESTVFGGIAGLSDKTVTKIRCQYEISTGDGPNTFSPEFEIPMPPDGTDLRGVRIRAYYQHGRPPIEIGETTDPNPPPVVLTLPQGSKGVDLSNYQAGFFNLVDPADFDFFIFRCSDGMNTSATSNNHDANGVDKALWEFADVGHVSMRPWGIYHFLRPGNVQGQVSKVLGILQALKERGTPPRTAVFDNGVKLPAVWIDVEDGALTSAQVQEFYNLVAAGHHTGIYTGKPIWESITAGAAVWWSAVPLWIAAYGVNDGNVPPWTNGPFLPRGYVEASVWQYTSNPVDKNIVGPYPPTAVEPPPPPTGATYSTSFMKAVPNAWRVIQRFDGSGEDIWDLPLGGSRFVRVKNFNEGEWYNGNMRERDTSPAPQTDGTERLYLLNGGAGGQIAPDTAVVGVTYSFTNYVQFKAKQGCADLAENSGTAVSTFLLKEVIDNYTFPSTGFTVDRLFWTVQTGENQLYATKDGVNIGWVGGGASQDNNVWGGALAELYFDRSIPQQEPPKYC